MGNIQSRRQKLFFFSALVAGGLILLSLIPGKLGKALVPFPFLWNLGHVVFYGFFCFLLCLYFQFRRTFLMIRMRDRNVAWVGFVISIAWGGLNEWIQVYIPGRFVTWDDMSYNVVGAFLGMLSFLVFKKFFRNVLFTSGPSAK